MRNHQPIDSDNAGRLRRLVNGTRRETRCDLCGEWTAGISAHRGGKQCTSSEEAHANAERLRAEYEQAAPGPEAELARKSWENAKLIARIEANNARIDREERELKRDRANLRRFNSTIAGSVAWRERNIRSRADAAGSSHTVLDDEDTCCPARANAGVES